MADDEPYELVITPHVRRALSEELPESVAFAVFEFLRGPLRDEPRRVGAALRAPFEGLFRARRGEYRIRYEIDEGQRMVIVHDVEHRRDAYRS